MNFKKSLQNEMFLSFHHVEVEFGENEVKRKGDQIYGHTFIVRRNMSVREMLNFTT